VDTTATRRRRDCDSTGDRLPCCVEWESHLELDVSRAPVESRIAVASPSRRSCIHCTESLLRPDTWLTQRSVYNIYLL